MATIEDIKRRVKALIAKKNGGTEQEIASALALAKKLMGEWALTESDLGGDQAKSGVVEAGMKPRTAPPQWELNIGRICEELFSVKAYASSAGTKTTLKFVGFPADIELAIELFTVLKSQVMKLASEYQKSTGCSYGERCRFSYGVIFRLIANIKEAQQAVKEEDDARCRGLVLAKKDIVRAWVKENLKLVKTGGRVQRDEHFDNGVAAAGRVDMGMRQKVEGR